MRVLSQELGEWIQRPPHREIDRLWTSLSSHIYIEKSTRVVFEDE